MQHDLAHVRGRVTLAGDLRPAIGHLRKRGLHEVLGKVAIGGEQEGGTGELRRTIADECSEPLVDPDLPLHGLCQQRHLTHYTRRHPQKVASGLHVEIWRLLVSRDP